jgi:hypothetical protein
MLAVAALGGSAAVYKQVKRKEYGTAALVKHVAGQTDAEVSAGTDHGKVETALTLAMLRTEAATFRWTVGKAAADADVHRAIRQFVRLKVADALTVGSLLVVKGDRPDAENAAACLLLPPGVPGSMVTLGRGAAMLKNLSTGALDSAAFSKCQKVHRASWAWQARVKPGAYWHLYLMGGSDPDALNALLAAVGKIGDRDGLPVYCLAEQTTVDLSDLWVHNFRSAGTQQVDGASTPALTLMVRDPAVSAAARAARAKKGARAPAGDDDDGKGCELPVRKDMSNEDGGGGGDGDGEAAAGRDDAPRFLFLPNDVNSDLGGDDALSSPSMEDIPTYRSIGAWASGDPPPPVLSLSPSPAVGGAPKETPLSGSGSPAGGAATLPVRPSGVASIRTARAPGGVEEGAERGSQSGSGSPGTPGSQTDSFSMVSVPSPKHLLTPEQQQQWEDQEELREQCAPHSQLDVPSGGLVADFYTQAAAPQAAQQAPPEEQASPEQPLPERTVTKREGGNTSDNGASDDDEFVML